MRRRVEGCGECVKCVRCCGVSGWRQGGGQQSLESGCGFGLLKAAPWPLPTLPASLATRRQRGCGLRFPAARSPLFQGVDGAHARVSWVGSDVIGSAKATMLR